MKKLAILALAFGAAVSASGQNNVIDEVIWVVGDEPIMKSEVEEARLDALSRGERFDADPYCVIPENLAIQKLFLHQAAIDSVEVTDSEVQQDVELRVNYFVQQIGSKEKVEEYFGKPMQRIRERLFDNVRNERLIEQVQENLVADVQVTPAQVRHYFKEIPEDSLPYIPTKYEVQLLVRKPIISQTEIDRVKDELRDYTERVNSGSSKFSTLAVLYSEDKGTASRGGECGFQSRSAFVPEFATAAFNLTDPNTVSKIVETEYGFHIIQLIEKRGDRVNVRHILRKPRVSDEELVNCINQVDSIVQGVKNGDYTFDEAVTHTSEDKDTRANYGIMFYAPENSPLQRTSKVELKNLPSEVAKAVAGLTVDSISKPFVMVDKSGKEVVAVCKLKNKYEGHRANMREDYQELQAVVKAKRNQEVIDQWIRDMQAKTYIRINEDWRNCEFQYPGWIK